MKRVVRIKQSPTTRRGREKKILDYLVVILWVLWSKAAAWFVRQVEKEDINVSR